MSNPSARLVRTLWEALIIGPALLLALTWIGIVVIGLIGSGLGDHVRPAIDRVMSLLLIGCFCSFGIGLLGVAVTHRRHPGD